MNTEVINYTEQIQEILNKLECNNAYIYVLISLIGIIAISCVIRLVMALYSKIKNNKRSKN